MGVVAVIGDILQAAEESAVVLLAQPLSRGLLLLLQSHAALLRGRLSSTEHTVNLPQSLRENQSRINLVGKFVGKCDRNHIRHRR